MHWLGLDYDEGPIYQMQRLERYHEVVDADDRRRQRLPLLLHAGRARRDARGAARARREDALRRPLAPRARQDAAAGARRREAGGALSQPARRHRDLGRPGQGPDHDQQRRDRRPDHRCAPDGVPTYNFGVVVDDWDMRITHVFRGDEHINNTPWQINIFRALGAPLPLFGHCPIILGDDGLKLSKRRGAVSVTPTKRPATCPRRCSTTWRGWAGAMATTSSSRASRWCSGSTAATWPKSPAQWDPAKLRWVNAHYIKTRPTTRAGAAGRRAAGERAASPRRRLSIWRERCALFKDRCATTVELADWLRCSSRRRAAERRGPGGARHRCGAAGARDAARASSQASTGTRPRSRGDQGDAGRARAQDAAAGACRCACWCAAARRRRRSMPCSRCSTANVVLARLRARLKSVL